MDSVKKQRFRGKFKNYFCIWLQFKRKKYIVDDDNDDDDDWDKGDLINGNKPVAKPVAKHRRRGIFQLFNKVM